MSISLSREDKTGLVVLSMTDMHGITKPSLVSRFSTTKCFQSAKMKTNNERLSDLLKGLDS